MCIVCVGVASVSSTTNEKRKALNRKPLENRLQEPLAHVLTELLRLRGPLRRRVEAHSTSPATECFWPNAQDLMAWRLKPAYYHSEKSNVDADLEPYPIQ